MKNSRFVTNTQKYDTPRVHIVGGERNGHGTRISRKITCQKCGKLDYVAVSRTKASAFCRDCAKTEMRAYEKGTKIDCEKMEVSCCQCKKTFDFPKLAKNVDSLLCRDCYQGFEIWNGSLAAPRTESDLANFSRRPSGVLLRARK